MAEFDDASAVRVGKAALRVERMPHAGDAEHAAQSHVWAYGEVVLVRVTGGMDDAMRAFPGVIVERTPAGPPTTSSTTTSSTTTTLPPLAAGKVECSRFPQYGDTSTRAWVYVEPADAGGVAVGSSILAARIIGVEADGAYATFHSAKCAVRSTTPAPGCLGFGLWTWTGGTTRTWALTSSTCTAPCASPPPQFCPDPADTACVTFRSPCQSRLVAPVTCNSTTTTVSGCPTCTGCATYRYNKEQGWVLVACKCPVWCPCWPGGLGAVPTGTGLPSPDVVTCGDDGSSGNYAGNGGAELAPCSGTCRWGLGVTGWYLLFATCPPVDPSDPAALNGCRCPNPGDTGVPPTADELCGRTTRSTQCGYGDPCAPMNTTTTVKPGTCKGVCFYRWNTGTARYDYAGTTCVRCTCAPPPARGGETACSFVTVPCGDPPTTTSTSTSTTSTTSGPPGWYCVSPPASTYKYCTQTVPSGYTVNGGPYATLASCNSACTGPTTTTTTRPPCPGPPAGCNLVGWMSDGTSWALARNDCTGTPTAPATSAADWAATYGPGCFFWYCCTSDPLIYCWTNGSSYSCGSASPGAGYSISAGPYATAAACTAAPCGAPAIGCWQHAATGTFNCFGANPGTGWSLVSGPYATLAACAAAPCGPTTTTRPPTTTFAPTTTATPTTTAAP